MQIKGVDLYSFNICFNNVFYLMVLDNENTLLIKSRSRHLM